MTHSTHTNRQLFWNEGSPDIFANWYGDKNVKIATVITPAWHEDAICGGREAGANAARIVQCWNAHDYLVDALEHCKQVFLRYEINRVDHAEIEDEALKVIQSALAKARGEA